MVKTLLSLVLMTNILFVMTTAGVQCPENENYDPCPSCAPDTCDSIGKQYNCPLETPDNCKGACRCRTDYLRNSDAGVQCPENEEYDECPSCVPDTCDSIGKPYNCPIEPPKNCEGACRCKTSYYRNSSNICVLVSECH
ncbi:zonadhesin-like [Achroia grisella]|uniref:zonadhesin-like n=1 Tax=Achroia grisella TaxID=688607 RepID=UPI0027D242B9|nr:zonadhesin-like [Achroia grisella]